MKLAIALLTTLQLALVLGLLKQAQAYDAEAYKNPHYLDGRTSMVHLFEWKFKDIAEECERFLGPMGFGGVQVSPISECLIIKNRPWYERYQPISYKLISRSGSESEFKEMVRRCNEAKVRVYVDAVINHMTADTPGPALGVAGSKATPSNKDYPEVPYEAENFHSSCGINGYGNADDVRNCELNGLHDLDQSQAYVKDKIVEFLNRIIDHGVAGLRIDGAKHMNPNDLRAIYERLNDLSSNYFPAGSRPYIYQEVIDLGGEAVSKNEYTGLGAVIEFVYGITLGERFRDKDKLAKFENWGYSKDRLIHSNDALVMVDNHDNQRGHGAGGEVILSHRSDRLYKMAVSFMLAHPYGKTRVMSSYRFVDTSQGPPADNKGNIISPDPITGDVAKGANANDCKHGWVCEHRWSQIYGMVEFRNVVKDAILTNWWSNGENKIAFSRGNLGFVAFNGQEGIDLSQELQTGLPAGRYCDVISGRKIGNKCTGKSVTVNDQGRAHIKILANEPDGVLAIHAKSKL